MNRTAVYGLLLVALGLAAGVSLGWRGERGRVEPVERRLGGSASASGQRPGASETQYRGDRHATGLERRLQLLASKLAAEANERRRLEQRIQVLAPLRYGESRIFSPSELVTATRGGIAGETVRVEIIRQGQRFEIEVPRGPLGVRIAASRGNPDEG